MASCSSADHARGVSFGPAQAELGDANADRGGSPTRRGIESSNRVCPCVQTVRQKPNRKLPPRRSIVPVRFAECARCRQGLALGEHLARTSVSTSPASRNGATGERRGVPRPSQLARQTEPLVRSPPPEEGAREAVGGRRPWLRVSWLASRHHAASSLGSRSVGRSAERSKRNRSGSDRGVSGNDHACVAVGENPSTRPVVLPKQRRFA